MSEKDSQHSLAELYGPEAAVVYQEFLKPSQWGIDSKDADRIRNRLLKKENKIDREILRQLETIVKETGSNLKWEVVRARQVLERFFREDDYGRTSDWVNGLGGRLLVWGSIQYGDPRNLDADLTIVTRNHISKTDEEREMDIHDRLISEWEAKGIKVVGGVEYNEPHITLFSLEDFKVRFRSLLTSPEIVQDWSEDIISDSSSAGEVISAMALYPKDTSWLKRFKKDLTKFVESNPLLTAFLNNDLEGVLQIRKDRRGLKK